MTARIPKGHKGGRVMTPQELDQTNLECDLISLINQRAWPHGEKITKDLLELFKIEPKGQRPHAISLSAKNA